MVCRIIKILVIARSIEDSLVFYGTGWNSNVVEVAGIEPKSAVEPS